MYSLKMKKYHQIRLNKNMSLYKRKLFSLICIKKICDKMVLKIYQKSNKGCSPNPMIYM